MWTGPKINLLMKLEDCPEADVEDQGVLRNDSVNVRQCGPVVRALALRSGDPGFKTRSDRSLNLILVVPGSTSQLHL